MHPSELTDEQKMKLKSCKDSAELKSMLNELGVELTDEQLEEAAGGEDKGWSSCDSHVCTCHDYLMKK